MRQLILAIFLIAALNCTGQVFEVTPENTQHIVQKRERARTVTRLRSDLIGGTWLLFYDVEKTRKVEQCTYKQEKRHGEYIAWYLNQQIRRTVRYEEGKKTGLEIIYYENGNKKSESSSHSITDTICDRKEWYKTGELRYDERRDGLKRLGTVYYQDGSIKCEQVDIYTDDETTIIPQYKRSSEVCRCKNGNILYNITSSSDAAMPYKEYFCSGQLKAEGSIIQSKSYKVGVWKYYRPDGSLERTEQYKEGDTILTAGKKDGKWYYYGEGDKVVKLETYENGKLIDTSYVE